MAAIVAINDKKSAAEATIQSEREACRAVIVRVNEGKAGMDALDEATRNLRVCVVWIGFVGGHWLMCVQVVEEVCRQNIEALEEEERVLLGVLMA